MADRGGQHPGHCRLARVLPMPGRVSTFSTRPLSSDDRTSSLRPCGRSPDRFNLEGRGR
jgi:hypothetical protein